MGFLANFKKRLILALVLDFAGSLKTDETRLIDEIMSEYNSAARPVYNASKTVDVHFSLTLTQINDMVSSPHI